MSVARANDDPLVETLASLMPRCSEIVVCMDYSEVRSTRAHPFEERNARVLRRMPPGMAGSFALAGIGGNAGLPSTQVVLCTRDVLLWTSSYFEPGDGVVTEEVVTANLIGFADILGAKVRKKGRVDIWVEDGPTVTFRTTPDAAAELCLSVEKASASV